MKISAQRFGGNPSSQRWKQIETDTARIIFPAGNEKQAAKIASIIHGLQQQNKNSLGSGLRKINIVLQHRTLFSNAYVGLAPYRSEFYTTAPQNAFELGGYDWISNLAVHEYRHVQQYNNFNKGFSKFASVILGEEGQAVANAASVPDWFFEGDAVYNETLLTKQGRGKLPAFFNGYMSLYQSEKNYDYMKLRNGSMQHYVPNHYELGYLLVAYGRKQYGDDLWEKVTNDAARFKPLLYPFQGAIKKHTGIPFNKFVDEALSYYRSQWKKTETVEPEWITAIEKNNVVNDRYPTLMEDGSILTLHNSNSTVPRFEKISPEGKREKIVVRDIAIDPYFTYKKNKLVYTAYQPDKRWVNVEYNALKILDLVTRTEKTVRSGTRLFSPDISNDLAKILAVDMRTDGSAALVQLKVLDGVADTILTSSDKIYSYPRYAKNDKGFYTIYREGNGNMGISWFNEGGDDERKILEPTNRVLGYLQVQGDTLLFTSTGNGSDELWAVIDDGKRSDGPYKLASYPTGIYQGVLTRQKLIGAVFTADGYRLAAFAPKWEKITSVKELAPLYTGNTLQASGFGFTENIRDRNFETKPYKKFTRPLNIHSWRPYYDRPEYSFTLYGENVLNTYSSEFAYTYNENEGSHKLSADIIKGDTYLQPFFGIANTFQRSGALNRDTTLYWDEFSWRAGLRLPLNLTSGKFYRNLLLQASFNNNQVSWTGIAKKLFKNTSVNYLDLSFSYAAQSQRAIKHIFPRWGISVGGRYRSALGKTEANQVLFTGAVYSPGLLSTHNLVLTGAIQLRDTLNQYIFSDNFPFARGYRSVNFPRMYKIGLNYHFPLLYPDLGFGQLVYFQRVRMNVFYDETVGKSLRTGRKFHFGSVGGELMFDTKWWNQEPVSFGLRYSRLLDQEFSGATQANYWEIILPVALFR